MTTVQESAAVRHGIWVLCPALGAAIAWGLQLMAGWIAGLAWFPFQGWFRLAAEAPEPWRTTGALGLGAVAGLVLALLWAAGMLAVTVSYDEVTLQRKDKRRTFARADVDAVFMDGKHLVLLDSAGAELARDKSDLNARSLRSAFSENGYPWRDDDPHAEAYRMWVSDTPDLSGHVNALFAERKKALREFNDEDAAELADELRKHGVFVRDVKKRQYWRT